MTLCLLPAAIDFDGVGHRLERVERETYGKNDVEAVDRPVGQPGDVCDREVCVLEKAKHADVRTDARHQPKGTPPAFCTLNQNPRHIVDQNGPDKNEEVYRDEAAVEVDARQQQPKPPELYGKEEDPRGDNGKEESELEGVEEHRCGLGAER